MRLTILASPSAAGLRLPDAAHPVHIGDDLVSALLRAGHDARLVVLPGPGDRPAHAYDGLAAEGEWFAAQDGGDVVHAVDLRAAAAALAARRHTGVPVVVRASSLPDSPDARVRRARLAVLRAADVVLCPTEELARGARVAGADRVEVVADGLDTASWAAPSTPAADGPPTLVTLSGADAGGGVPAVVEALRALPEARLLVAGRSTEAAADSLRRRATRAGVDDRVTDLGWLPRDRVVELIDDADVVVAPRAEGGSGVSALEAMCRAKVVVAADAPVLRDVVAEGVTGLLVPALDSSAWADALRGVLADPFRREAWGQAGQDRVTAVYDWRAVVPRLHSVYEALRTVSSARSRVSRLRPTTGGARLARGGQEAVATAAHRSVPRSDAT